METTLRPLTLGEILDRTAELYRSNFLLLAGISSVYGGILLVLSLLQIGAQQAAKAMHLDTGLIVVSTTNPFGMAYSEAAQAIRTLVHPTPVISIHMSKLPEEPPAAADIVLSGPADFDAATKRILDELKRRGVLAQAIGAKPTFQYSI